MAIDVPILFPRCLYGDWATTRAAWRQIAETAWREGSWTNAFSNLQMVPVEAYPAPIIVWNDDRLLESTCEPVRWQVAESVWQLNWILEVHPAPIEELIDHGDLTRFQQRNTGRDHMHDRIHLTRG